MFYVKEFRGQSYRAQHNYMILIVLSVLSVIELSVELGMNIIHNS